MASRSYLKKYRPSWALLLLGLQACVVRSPTPYQGDVANKNIPLVTTFDPDEASHTQPPVPTPTNVQRAQRQEENEELQTKKGLEYDYYYLHTPWGTELKRKLIQPSQ